MTFNDNFIIPGPPFEIDLSCLDACHPVHYSRRLLIFRSISSVHRDAQLAALKTGLKALVLRCPPLAGIITPLPLNLSSNFEKEWRTIVPGQGLELVIKDLRAVIPSYEELEATGFSPANLPYHLLVPIPQDIRNDRPFAACKMQFSAIEGGTILTFAMSHCVADGSGTNELLRILSEETRLAQKHPSDGAGNEMHSGSTTEVIGLDRSIISTMTSGISFNIEDHPGYRRKQPPTSIEPPLEQPQRHPFQAALPEIPVLFPISAAAVAQLKSDATLPGVPWISTHDAISALLWRTQILIRRCRSEAAQSLPDSTLCTVFMPSDARRHLNLPQSYVGNVVYQLAATLDLGTLISPSGLQHAAVAIRRAITAASAARVSSYVARMREGWIDWAFLSTASTTGVAMGTDWTSGTLYGDDWGEAFGPMIRYRYPAEAFNCIMPKLPDGGAEVMVSVMPKEVEELKAMESFMKYVEVR